MPKPLQRLVGYEIKGAHTLGWLDSRDPRDVLELDPWCLNAARPWPAAPGVRRCPRTSALSKRYSGGPGPGEIVVAAEVISIDPRVRTMIDPGNPHGAPMPLGQTVTGDMAGTVVASRNPDFTEGDRVAGRLGRASHGIDDGGLLRRLDPALGETPLHLTLLGSSGLTACFGVVEIGRPRPADTVLVSGAAGAVGQVTGQRARAASTTASATSSTRA